MEIGVALVVSFVAGWSAATLLFCYCLETPPRHFSEFLERHGWRTGGRRQED